MPHDYLRGWAGGQLLDRAALFGKSGRLEKEASFELKCNGKVRVLVCDLEPGIWEIKRDGKKLEGEFKATVDGKCIYFRGPSGSYVLKLQTKQAVPPREDMFWNRLRGGK